MKKQRFELRLSEYELNKIKALADRYANGNVSLWIRYSGLNAPRKKITMKDLEQI